MQFNIEQLNSEPFITPSALDGFKPKENYVFDVKGFIYLLCAAKNYNVVDTALNDGIRDRKSTVELMLTQTKGEIHKFTEQNTREVITACMETFGILLDKYAQQLKTEEVNVLSEIQLIHIHLVLYDIIGYASLFNACIPGSLISRLAKYQADIVEFLRDILHYMIFLRREFHTEEGELYKVFVSLSLIHNLQDEKVNEVKKIWNRKYNQRRIQLGLCMCNITVRTTN